jgi:hypothetical protein
MAKKQKNSKSKKSVWNIIISFFGIFVLLLLVTVFTTKSPITPTSDQTEAATAVISPSGTKNVLIILMNFADDKTQPFTKSEVQNSFFGTSSVTTIGNTYTYSAKRYFEKASSQKFTITTTAPILGYYTVGKSADCYVGDARPALRTFANTANSMAKSVNNIDTNNYDVVYYIYPNHYYCAHSSTGAVSGASGYAEAYTNTATQKRQLRVWLNGTDSPVSIVKYMLQNIGADIIGTVICYTGSDYTTVTPITWKLKYCTGRRGAGYFDPTGTIEGNLGGTTKIKHTYQPIPMSRNKIVLGWMPQSKLLSLDARSGAYDGTIRLSALDIPAGSAPGFQSVRIIKKDFNTSTYYLEYRRGKDLDATTPINGNSGIYIWGYTTDSTAPANLRNWPYLIDLKPALGSTSGDLTDAALRSVGSVFYDNNTFDSAYPKGNDIRIKLIQKDDTAGYADVCIQLNVPAGVACKSAQPVL